MQLQALVALFAVVGATNAHDVYNRRHAHKRQAASGSAAASATISSLPSPSGGDISVLPLSEITSGATTQTTMALTTTYTAGASPPVSGAPALPTAFQFKQGDWPPQDQVAPTDSDEVKQWMKELDGFNIPNITPTKDGECATDPDAANSAEQRGWWTCGGYTRDTDIVACPDKYTWGVSFDDGPSPYTPTLLKYLDEKDIQATFFVVGSRVIGAPQTLVDEYMAGHEISLHTWSHRPLTSLTTEQIVAEFGWTRKAIQTVLGVTPTTMRPPYGDIDDRVRAIALAMGMVPIIWSRSPSGITFDTNDWKVPGGVVTGPESFQTFESILGNASTMDTGFIVLEHDLYPQTVDLAVGYTLNAALTHDPAFKLEPIGKCMKYPPTDLYLETTTNQTFPYRNSTAGSKASDNSNASSASQSSSSSAEFQSIPGLRAAAFALGVALVGGALL